MLSPGCETPRRGLTVTQKGGTFEMKLKDVTLPFKTFQLQLISKLPVYKCYKTQHYRCYSPVSDTSDTPGICRGQHFLYYFTPVNTSAIVVYVYQLLHIKSKSALLL